MPKRKDYVPDPSNPTFWVKESEIMYEILFPMVQQMAVDAALRSYTELAGMVELGLSWEVVNQMAIDWANNYTVQVVSQISKTSMAAFLEKFQPWLLSGEPLPALIEQLAPFYGEIRAEMIAVTEVTRAFAEGNMLFWNSTGMVTGYNFRTARDEKVCPLCDNISGAASRNPHRMDDTEDLPPRHVRCILPGNDVVIPDLVAAAKSFYDGWCVEIILANGSRLSVTENHPILTPRGWVRAKFLNQFDDVIIARDGQRIAESINPNNDNRPARVEEIFRSLEMSGEVTSIRVKASAEDFHGDGRSIYGDIEIVEVNRLLRGNIKPSLFEPVGKLQLDGRGADQRPLVRKSVIDFLGIGNDSSSHSLMRRGDLGGSLASTHRTPFQSLGFGLTSRPDAILQQEPAYHVPVHTQRSREFVFRHSADVAADNILRIRKFNFSGHVYDLQSDMYGLYNCNGVIVKNCRCGITPILENF